MALFVHLTAEKDVRNILRNGIKMGASGRVYAMPVVPHFYKTHQWLRELKRRFGTNGWRTIRAVYFRVPDSTLVWAGLFSEPHEQLSAAAAAKMLMHPETPLGFEVYLTRSILRKEIHKVRALPQVIGWRYLPESHGTKPCGCRYCSYGNAFRRNFRDAFKAEEQRQYEKNRREDPEFYADW
jgi:hypothetical protein